MLPAEKRHRTANRNTVRKSATRSLTGVPCPHGASLCRGGRHRELPGTDGVLLLHSGRLAFHLAGAQGSDGGVKETKSQCAPHNCLHTHTHTQENTAPTADTRISGTYHG